jgi:transposase
VIAPRASLTERARAEICRRVGEDGASVAAVAREFGIGWRTAMAAVREHGTRRVDDPERWDGVEALGLDETTFQAASARRSTSLVTGIIDVTRGRGPARLLDVVEDRSAAALVSWINERDPGGGPGSPPPRWTPTAAMHLRYAPPYRRPRGYWTPSTSCGWP